MGTETMTFIFGRTHFFHKVQKLKKNQPQVRSIRMGCFWGNECSLFMWSWALVNTALCIHPYMEYKLGEAICQNEKCCPCRRQAVNVYMCTFRSKHKHIHAHINITCVINILCLTPRDVKTYHPLLCAQEDFLVPHPSASIVYSFVY